MAIRPDWNIGTITLTASSADFTTTGALLETAAIEPGDAIITPSGAVLVISSITGQDSGTLMLPCPAGAAGANMPLRIRFQPDGSRFQAAYKAAAYLLSGGNVDALAGLTGAANTMPYFTGAGTMGRTGLSAFARSLLEKANAAQFYGSLGEIPNEQIPPRLQESASLEYVDDANLIKKSGWYMAASNNPNTPLNFTCIIQCFMHLPTHGRQILYQRDGSRIFSRNLLNGVFTAWEEIGGGNVASNGWIKLPSGLIIQWGTSVVTLGGTFAATITLPTTFPNNLFSTTLTNGDWGASGQRLATLVVVNTTTSSVQFAAGGGTASSAIRVNYVVFGG